MTILRRLFALCFLTWWPLVAVCQTGNVKDVEPSVFDTLDRPEEGVIWLFTNKVEEQNLTLYQARFISQMTLSCIDALDFSDPNTLDAINRKTRFDVDEGQLKGKRSVGLLSITFDTDVKVENSLAQIPASFSVEQRLYNYNMFVDNAQFAFVLHPVSVTEVLVDLKASNTVSSNIPGWMNRMFQSDVSDKVMHFQNALNELCAK